MTCQQQAPRGGAGNGFLLPSTTAEEDTSGELSRYRLSTSGGFC